VNLILFFQAYFSSCGFGQKHYSGTVSYRKEKLMDFNHLFNEIKCNGDPQKAEKMSAYMRSQFSFLGIPALKRTTLCRECFKMLRMEKQVN